MPEERFRDEIHPIPGFEVNRRIKQGDEAVEESLRGDVKRVEKKVDELTGVMGQLVGSKELPGILSRIESELAEIKSEQRIILDRRGPDDAFRKEITDRTATLEAEVKKIRMVSTLINMVATFFTGVGTMAGGKAPKTLFAILGGVFWLIAIQFWHTVWPMIRESYAHHRLMH